MEVYKAYDVLGNPPRIIAFKWQNSNLIQIPIATYFYWQEMNVGSDRPLHVPCWVNNSEFLTGWWHSFSVDEEIFKEIPLNIDDLLIDLI